MAKIKKIEDRTLWFIETYESLEKAGKLPTNTDLAKIMGMSSKSTITNILKKDQNIQPSQLDKFKKHFGYAVTREGSDKNEREPTAMEILAGLKDGFVAIAQTMRNMESKMAQESTQAKILKAITDQESNFEKSYENQLGLAALIGEMLMRDFGREAKNNPDAVQKILRDFLQRIGPKLSLAVKESIGADGRN